MEPHISRILIAEDEVAHAEAMRRALLAGQAAAEIESVPTLAAFRAAAAERPPDLALVDLNLPDGRAVDVLTDPPEAGAFPILVVTAHGSEQTAVEALKAGALDYVVKSPASFADLPRTVARAWREWRTRLGRRQAEADLREREELLRLLFENAGEAIILTDPGGRVESVNPAACRLFGRTEAEMRVNARCDLVDPFDDRLAAAVTAREATGTFTGELNYRRLDGSVFPVEVTSTLYADSSGRQRASNFFRDLTEKKRAEANRAELEAQVRQSQRLDAMSTLSGGIAHDFNNILAAILGNAELARFHLPFPDHPADANLTAILKACERATHLVRQILTFARTGAPRRAAVPLAGAVEKAVESLRGELRPGVEPTLRLDPGAPAAAADAAQVHQAVTNLGMNAWHALEGRPGRITFVLRPLRPGELPPPPLDAGAAWTVLSVEDTGVGMDEATRARAFEPFFTAKGAGRGPGLGLAVVHGVMRAHGGAVTVRSAPGAGTTFDLFFPASAVSSPAAAPSSADSDSADSAKAPAEVSSGRHVLCVDDEASIVALTRTALESRGHRVTTCTRADEALALLRARASDFDLVLTDYNMPGVTGLAVAREAARLAPRLPVVVASGFIDDDARREAAALGVRRLLLKPVGIADLCRAVAEGLAGA